MDYLSMSGLFVAKDIESCGFIREFSVVCFDYQRNGAV